VPPLVVEDGAVGTLAAGAVTPCVTEILIKSLNLQLCHKVRANQVVKV
jgi:hypothetical protein